jgi:4-hydroxy-3-polyprenylbenzoate decarboxylase
MSKKRIILAVTGASGMPYAVALAKEISRNADLELHLVLSDAARKVLELESDVSADELSAMAHTAYPQDDLTAGPASGSWRNAGMIVCPCSMASLAAIANGLGSNLIHRAADVALKEGRKLVLVPRETPLSEIHLKNLLAAKQAGAAILPACPGFYSRPKTIDDLAGFIAARALDLLDIPHAISNRWKDG